LWKQNKKPKAMTITTTTLNDKKTTVLAKKTKYGINALTYSNDTMAHKKANELRAQGIDCRVYNPPTNFSVRFIKIN
jgi:hypothetical protein